jgi:signal transduction histidine kinase
VRLVRRRLFWRIYLTLLASLVATALIMGALFWFLGQAQRELRPDEPAHHRWPPVISLYEADGRLVAAQGKQIPLPEAEPSRHWAPGHVLRVDLPDGRFALVHFEPPPGARVRGIIGVMLFVVFSVGLAAFPVTALLTRRLERLREGLQRWGETGTYAPLDARGDDEVALLARTFNAAAARLDALLAAQKRLLANASHELRSPLARLRFAAETAPSAGPARDEIVRNLGEMDGLVEELLLASRLEHQAPARDRREPVDLLGLAAEEAARFDAIVDGAPVEVLGDLVLLRRLVRNLLDNAARHGRPPTTVHVAPRDGGAELVVSDAGAGIAPGDREKVFEPFFRPGGIGEDRGGWGLGLALVRQIAERHGGTATCEAAENGGSRFVVRLAAR